MTSFVLLHWFTSALHLIDMLILSTMFLQISGYARLIRQPLLLLVKFSLWSFMVKNAGFGIVHGR